MSFLAIRGTVHVTGYQPDGDSMRFHANEFGRWRELHPFNPEPGAKWVEAKPPHRRAQLRIEIIDTLETHFAGVRQPRALGGLAADRLQYHCGMRKVIWDANHTKVLEADDGQEIMILTASADKYHRPISIMLTMDEAERLGINDGAWHGNITKEIFRASINYKMLAEGMAYPTLYENMPAHLRSAVAMVVGEAREQKLGIWAADRTLTEGARILGLGSLTGEVMDVEGFREEIVMPKIFRRFASYAGSLKDSGQQPTLQGFKEYLEQKPDRILLVDEADPTQVLQEITLADALEIEGNVLKLKYKPELLIFRET